MAIVRFDFDDVFGQDYLHFYTPRLTDERNRAETAEIISLLGLKHGNRVLDAPCGHGRISNLLASQGVAVTGVDSSQLFLDKALADAEAAGVQVTYRRGDLRDLPVEEGEFDAVVNWFTSFGYFDDEENHLVLREFHRVLRQGGRLLIEMMNRDGIVRAFAAGSSNVERAEPDDEDLMIDTSTFDAIAGRLFTERIVVRDGKMSASNFSVRLLAPTEFRAWLEAAGFQSIRFQSRGDEPLRTDSRRLVVLADA